MEIRLFRGLSECPANRNIIFRLYRFSFHKPIRSRLVRGRLYLPFTTYKSTTKSATLRHVKLRLSHNYFDVNFFFGCIHRNEIALNCIAIHGNGSNTFFYMIRVFNLNVVSCATEITFGGEAVHKGRDAGIYDQTVIIRADTEDILGNIYRMSMQQYRSASCFLPLRSCGASLPAIIWEYTYGSVRVDFTDIFDICRTGLLCRPANARFPRPTTVSAHGNPRVVVAENTGILFVSRWIRRDFTEFNMISVIR